jgi:hypothetical protein
MRHEGMTGMFAIDDNDRKTAQNLNFRKMYNSLKERGDDWCVPLLQERREMVAWINGSSLAFDNANKRQKGTLGRSLGMNLFFGDEVAFWQDEDSLLSLMASLDDANPNRLYIWASTAQGFNLFQRMCDKFEEASNCIFVFLGWWLQDWYRIERDDELGQFEQYWDGQLNDEESEWVEEVKLRYGHDLVPEQIAWWRMMLATKFMGNLEAMYQEYPPIPEKAFQYGGSNFFNAEALRITTIEINSPTNTYKPRYFRFRFGKNIMDTKCEECEGKSGLYHLSVFDPPRHGEGVMYSMGVDPAFGMSEKSDYGCIQMLRCFEDGMEQVAEFAARGLSSMHLAWAVLYLFGAYHLTDGVPNVIWNTEIQGGGSAVIQTIEQVQQDIGGFYDRLGVNFDSLRAYAYKRIDSLTPNYTAKHWSTTAANRAQMLHHMKSYFESGQLKLHSLNLMYEMSRMIQGPDGYIQSSEGKHDDLVMALGIAIMNYWDPIRYDMEGSGFTLEKWLQEREMILKGVSQDDLLYMRVRNWIKDKRDISREREEGLRELLEGERASW